MATIDRLPVKSLSLDLQNFRTVHQKTEAKSIHAIIAINPEWFWALMQSLIDDGYHPTENIIVLKKGKECVVREGNRRIGALKIIHSIINAKQFDLPSHLSDAITPSVKCLTVYAAA